MNYICLKLLKIIKNPYKIKYIWYKHFCIKKVSDKKYLEAFYSAAFGHKMDFDNPKTYNQKLQWLKLYYRNPKYVDLVDKYEVKKIVEDIIGKEYLIDTYGIYSSFSEIDFSILPDQFVLKCTHDSGSVILCKDKKKLNLEEAREKLEYRLFQNPFWDNREWPYKNVVPRIICEKYLKNDDESEILDYKFMCFDGEPKCVFICSNRLGKELYVDFFDLEWNHLPFERHYHNSPEKIDPPKNLELMISLAKKLSKGMPHVRVDFYEVNGRVYFGELTFFPGSGAEEFTPDFYDKMLGDWITLPEKIV